MAQDERPQTASEIAAREQFSALLQGSVLPTVAVGVVAVVVSAFFGLTPAVSAGVGAALVVVFFSLSVMVMRQTAHLAPTTVMAVVLATYTGKILALGLAMVLLRDAEWISGRALGLSVIACTIVWLGFEMRAFTRLRVLV